ncbi:hypothetical protein M0R45_018398 [Rubus argutus]|uniref:MULE transposase domain-containing protein n=1 Tax=Rubus argutus TaxID=59490 RepID=A0AAW1X2L0_RUBAR
MTVKLCKDRGVYYVSEFTTFHNHKLAKPKHRHFMRSHRKVKDSDIAAVTAMRKVSVKTSCAYEYLVHAAGGHEFVGFTIKDLYNKLNKGHAEVLLDGDAQACVTWMNMKAMRDPQFYCFFSVDEFGRLANLFWRDGQALVDYNAFGEILIFDSTYKSNIYGKPLAVLVGCNNHRATVLFGCALLVDETEETYMWLLTSFLTSMYGKKPCSVVTDGDEAMRNAIFHLLPESRHRNCTWHIGKNVVSNLKGAETQREFSHLIFAGLTIEEWEGRWQYFVSMNQLQNNKWVSSMYDKRDRWAEAFFRENFFGGICSTQRCEGMNRNLKVGIGRSMRLYEVMPRMEKTIARIRNRIAEDDYRSEHFEPVCGTHMRCLQEEVGRIFTHDIFLLIKDQINYESKFVVVHREEHPTTGMTLLSVTQYGKPH